MLANIIGANGTITVFAGSKTYTAAKDHPNYSRIVACLKEVINSSKEARIIKLLDIPYSVNKFTKGKAEIIGNEVYYNGRIAKTAISRRILEVMQQGLPFTPMLRFLENVMMNPSERSREELYKFLEHRAIPITEDGCFIGYKKVREDYMDFYTGKEDNRIGKKLRMPRENVDPNCNQHCSYGYHVGTIEYADKQYHSDEGRIVLVKVNPADAVSVPTDHSCQKLRVCAYEVIADYVSDLEKPVYNNAGNPYIPCQDVDDDFEGYLDEVPNTTKKNKLVYGIKPDGSRYYNHRVGGKFAKRK